MKEVWIIEEGEYSDYRVSGIYSTEKDAQMMCDLINKRDRWTEARIACRQLDPCVREMNDGLIQFDVTMLRNGDVEKCIESEYIDTSPELGHRKPSTYRKECVSGSVWARDVAHAIKIANEKRVQLVASGELLSAEERDLLRDSLGDALGYMHHSQKEKK
jgi:hypothetical protein